MLITGMTMTIVSKLLHSVDSEDSREGDARSRRGALARARARRALRARLATVADSHPPRMAASNEPRQRLSRRRRPGRSGPVDVTGRRSCCAAPTCCSTTRSSPMRSSRSRRRRASASSSASARGAHAMPQDEIERADDREGTRRQARRASQGRRPVRLRTRRRGGAGAARRGQSRSRSFPASARRSRRPRTPEFRSRIASTPRRSRSSTGHEDPAKPASTLDWAKLADPQRTLVLLDGDRQPARDRAAARSRTASTPRHAGRGRARRHAPERSEPCPERSPRSPPRSRARNRRARGRRDRRRRARCARRCAGSITAPLFGKRVLITRAGHQSDAFAARCCERGAEPISAPDDRHRAARRYARRPSKRSTSSHRTRGSSSRRSNGVDAFFDRLAARGADARAIGERESRRHRRTHRRAIANATASAPTSFPRRT